MSTLAYVDGAATVVLVDDDAEVVSVLGAAGVASVDGTALVGIGPGGIVWLYDDDGDQMTDDDDEPLYVAFAGSATVEVS